ncbi:MAG: YbfB/YjiJ family MFS transporter [Pseudomonas sp.]|uniref:YbfB/YjiJ family MFS transporter n=1 Tax=Pseudomonas sp. TaxID=306 RepID=UPI003D0FC8C1
MNTAADRLPSSSTAGALYAAITAALVLVVGMGFGRFSFTVVYPHMVGEGVLSVTSGSWAASANYAGYLAGALLAVRVRAHQAGLLCLVAMLGTALGLLLMGVVTTPLGILLIRTLAGVLSALSIVSASLWLLEQRGQTRDAPLLYAGVGAGIALSAEIPAWAVHGTSSTQLWLLLGAAAVIVTLLAAPGLLRRGAVAGHAPSPAASSPPAQLSARPLLWLYGLAGLGYIVTATYLPLFVKTVLPDLNPAHIWAVFGLGAVPSCFVWHRLQVRLGTPRALGCNLLLQAIGVALPVLLPTSVGYLLSALLVGGTFMGTVTIAIPAARQIVSAKGANMVALMTVYYSVGQIVGPLLSALLLKLGGGANAALLAAASALLIAAALTTVLVPGTPPRSPS